MKLLCKRILSYIPTPLPVGLTEFHAWADSIIELAGEFADRDSLKWALASNILHYKSNSISSVPKAFFVSSLRKAAANQVASQVFTDIKEKQAKKQAEVTGTTNAETSNADQKTDV